MATGVTNQPGGVAAPTDVPYAGASAWEAMTGVSAVSPLVGGPGISGRPDMPYAVDGSRSRIVSTGQGQAPPVSGPGVALLDDWRDAFNPSSPAMWLLVLILVMIGFMQLRVQARAGKAKGALAIG